MANNVISQMLEADSKFHPMWAVKLDRLVEAAKDALTDLCHFPWCNLYDGDNCSCGIGPVKDELTAALREIELPSEVEHGK